MTREEGCTSSESEKCDNEIEKSEASLKLENQKSENAQPLNKISQDLNQLIQFKEILKLIILLSFLGKYFILMQHAL